jgi:hypothetical protein
MHDRDVRLAVRRWLDDLHAGDDNTRVVEEMGIWAGSVRVDLAVINGEFHGFELKSERDTLERLPNQASLYSEVFDRVTLVLADRHAEKAMAKIPDWWGVFTAYWAKTDDLQLKILRRPGFNPAVKPVQVARILWRGEALALLEKYDAVKGFRSKPADILAHRIAAVLSLDVLRNEVRSALKARENWLGKTVGN